MVKDCPLASRCRSSRRVRLSTPASENTEKRRKRKSVFKKTGPCVGLLQHVPEDDGNNPCRSARYCNGGEQRRSWLQLFLTVFAREANAQLKHLTTAKESWLPGLSNATELGFLPGWRGRERRVGSGAVALPSIAWLWLTQRRSHILHVSA